MGSGSRRSSTPLRMWSGTSAGLSQETCWQSLGVTTKFRCGRRPLKGNGFAFLMSAKDKDPPCKEPPLPSLNLSRVDLKTNTYISIINTFLVNYIRKYIELNCFL